MNIFEQQARLEFIKKHEEQLVLLAETNIVRFDISFDIVTLSSGGFGISGHIAIDDVLITFPSDNEIKYETEHDAEHAAQKDYFKALTSFMSNSTLTDEENIRRLIFNHGGVAFEIRMYVVRHLTNFKIVGQLKQHQGFGEYITLDQFDSIELGYSEYDSPYAAKKAANNILKHVIANNLIFSCNKCAHATIFPDDTGVRICDNNASKFHRCVMEKVDDGCNSFQWF